MEKMKWVIGFPFVALGICAGFIWYNFYYGFLGGKTIVDGMAEETRRVSNTALSNISGKVSNA